MKIDIKVPQLPESVADGVVLDWRISVGQAVNRDDNLVEIETDKVVLEIPAPDNGVLSEITIPKGKTVTSGQVLAVLDTKAIAMDSPDPAMTADSQTDSDEVAETRPLAPAVKKLVNEHDIDINQVQGSGKKGRILKQDVLDYLQTGNPDELEQKEQKEPTEQKEQTTQAIADDQLAGLAHTGKRHEQRVPMTRLRAKIAERLLQSQQTAAILTTFNEVNMQPIMDLRSQYQEQFVKRHKIKLGFMSFFIKACTEALKQFPVVNASVEDQDIIYHGYYDIGVAVGSPRGLVVPVIRNTDTLSFAQIETIIKDYGERANSGKIGIEELSGGTFSVTNGGIFGSMLSTPIINPPQSAILGMHNIQQRAVVEKGTLVARPMMYLALSYDHRIIDGREAVQFLVTIKHLVEEPATMLLDL